MKNNKIVMINKCCNPLFELIFNAGCTTNSDGSGLPVHRTHRDEIIRMMAATTDAVNTTINAVGLPAGICFARSSLDGYCPPDQVEFIQSNLLASLESLFMSHSAQITVDKKYWTVFFAKIVAFSDAKWDKKCHWVESQRWRWLWRSRYSHSVTIVKLRQSWKTRLTWPWPRNKIQICNCRENRFKYSIRNFINTFSLLKVNRKRRNNQKGRGRLGAWDWFDWVVAQLRFCPRRLRSEVNVWRHQGVRLSCHFRRR